MIFTALLPWREAYNNPMCSRYFLDADGNIIAFTFRVPLNERIRKRFNIAPTQEAPVIRVRPDGEREAAMLRWGLVPFWAKDLKVGTKMINARSEGVESKPAFRAAVKERRCVVGEPVETFTIVTTEANEAIARIHDRMPVILPMDAIDTWLTAPPDEARALLKPYEEAVELRAVGTYVSNVNHEGRECLDDPAPGWAPSRQQSLL